MIFIKSAPFIHLNNPSGYAHQVKCSPGDFTQCQLDSLRTVSFPGVTCFFRCQHFIININSSQLSKHNNPFTTRSFHQKISPQHHLSALRSLHKKHSFKINMLSFISICIAALAACTLTHASTISQMSAIADVGFTWFGTISNGTTIHLNGTLDVSLPTRALLFIT